MSRNNLRQYLLSVIKLMRPFKWYMIFNGAYLFLLVFEYLNPPAKDDPIFGSVSTLDAWNYVNQEVYVESLKSGSLFLFCFFCWQQAICAIIRKLPNACFYFHGLIWLWEWRCK